MDTFQCEPGWSHFEISSFSSSRWILVDSKNWTKWYVSGVSPALLRQGDKSRCIWSWAINHYDGPVAFLTAYHISQNYGRRSHTTLVVQVRSCCEDTNCDQLICINSYRLLSSFGIGPCSWSEISAMIIDYFTTKTAPRELAIDSCQRFRLGLEFAFLQSIESILNP